MLTLAILHTSVGLRFGVASCGSEGGEPRTGSNDLVLRTLVTLVRSTRAGVAKNRGAFRSGLRAAHGGLLRSLLRG